jgi:plasmid stabilization system protein ParE
MARKVVRTETAWRDLERSADYIAEDSPGYAAAFVERVREQARALDELTLRGRVVPELGEPTVREFLIGNYRLIFEVHEPSRNSAPSAASKRNGPKTTAPGGSAGRHGTLWRQSESSLGRPPFRQPPIRDEEVYSQYAVVVARRLFLQRYYTSCSYNGSPHRRETQRKRYDASLGVRGEDS